MSRWKLLLLSAASALAPATVFAQTDANTIPAARALSSPERYIVELRGGPFSPGTDNDAYTRYFGDDSGPFLGFQLSYIMYRVPDIVYATIGGGFGWANVSGAASAVVGDDAVDEETSLVILPISAVASIRLDVLPRKFHVPFILTGKLGFTWAHWDANTGQKDDASGWSLGPVFAGQLALDLDTFDSSAARSLDEEWGINHSFLFFEVQHFATTEKSLPIGGTGWLVGLGFNF